jgi:hypothetical protein
LEEQFVEPRFHRARLARWRPQIETVVTTTIHRAKVGTQFPEHFIPHFVRCIVVKISELRQLSCEAVGVFHSVMHIGVENFHTAFIKPKRVLRFSPSQISSDAHRIS